MHKLEPNYQNMMNVFHIACIGVFNDVVYCRLVVVLQVAVLHLRHKTVIFAIVLPTLVATIYVSRSSWYSL